jgi:hypothetical protein
LKAWVLSKVLGREVTTSELGKAELQSILSTKHYKSPDGSKEVMFAIP